MAGVLHLQNNYVLSYKFVDTENMESHFNFIFDNIVDMKTELGGGLYTEGTGNLRHVKGATNPVTFVFRKTLLDIKSADTTDVWQRFDIKEIDQFDFLSGNVMNISIFQWAEKINKGKLDSGEVTIYAYLRAVDAEYLESKNDGYVEFLKLNNALPISAVMKRNPYRGVDVAEITFVAEGMTASTAAQFDET